MTGWEGKSRGVAMLAVSGGVALFSGPADQLGKTV
jgi:hypothetical protein